MLTRPQQVALLAPFGVLVGLALVLPMLLGLLSSFTNYGPGEIELQLTGVQNYSRLLADPEFAIAARNVVIFTAVAVPAELAVGFALASLLQSPFRGRRIVRVLFLLPWLVSPIASGVMWRFLLGAPGGLFEFALALLHRPAQSSPTGQPGLALATVVAIEVWRMAPLVAFLLLPAMERIPSERFDEARLNGAGAFMTARTIVLPALRPLLFTVAMLLVGLSLGTFDAVLILTGGGPGSETMTPALYSYQQAIQSNAWPIGVAAAWLIVAAVALIGTAYVRGTRARYTA